MFSEVDAFFLIQNPAPSTAKGPTFRGEHPSIVIPA